MQRPCCPCFLNQTLREKLWKRCQHRYHRLALWFWVQELCHQSFCGFSIDCGLSASEVMVKIMVIAANENKGNIQRNTWVYYQPPMQTYSCWTMLGNKPKHVMKTQVRDSNNMCTLDFTACIQNKYVRLRSRSHTIHLNVKQHCKYSIDLHIYKNKNAHDV